MKPVHITCEGAVAVKVHRFQQQPRQLSAEGINWCIIGMLAPVPLVTNFNIIIIGETAFLRRFPQTCLFCHELDYWVFTSVDFTTVILL
jgi:hypothetical protein